MAVSIKIEDLSIGYKSGKKIRTVAFGLNATVDGGKLTCLIGQNGAGKSTLLRTMANFQPKLAGRVLIDCRDMSTLEPNEIARTVSVVLTSRLDALNMTVREVVGLGRTPYTGFWGTLGEEDREIVEQSIETVGIGHIAECQACGISDGERQKMMIAKALAQQAPVIILDEPTAFLDYPSKVETMRLLMRLAHEESKTILMSTHDLELALQTTDMLWLMSKEGLLHTGTPRQLADNGCLSTFIERPGIRFDTASMRIIIGK